MAFQGFEGFNFDSSEEVLAEFQAGIQQATTSGNVDAARMAVAQQAAFTVSGGSPEYKKAKKRERVLSEAAARASENETGDDVADQQNFYREVQQAAVDAELPEIAMMATAQLSQLTLLQEERAKLKAGEARASAKEVREQTAFDLDMEVAKVTKRHLTNGVLIDPQTLEVAGRYNLLDPADLGEMQELQKAREDLVFRTEGEYIELTEAEKDRKNKIATLGGGIGGRSTLYKKWFEKTQAADAFGTAADDFVDLLLHEDAAQFFAAGGRTKGLIQRAGAHVRSFLGDEGQDAVKDRFADDARWNTLSEEKQALMLELGYTLATSREGGRLTDQDVDRAIRTLGLDNPDPRAVAWIFGRALTRTRDTYERSLLTGGVQEVEGVQAAYDSTLAGLNHTLDRLALKYKIDFEDDELFDRLLNPTAQNVGLDDDGIKVRQVSPDNRGPQRRVIN